MRKCNAFLTAGIMVLFVVHLLWGVLMMMGVAAGGNSSFTALSYLMAAMIVGHIGIGCKLTIDTLHAVKKAGVSYPGQNRLFWIRRISGFALVLFMGIHVWIFTGVQEGGAFRLQHFNSPAFWSQILMVIALAVHLLTNIRPLKIALGIEDSKNYKTDILIVLSVLLLLSAIGFVIYLFRWRAV